MALATSPAMAKPRQPPPEGWRAFAEKLPSGSRVTVPLKGGEVVEGHVVAVTDDGLQVSPQSEVTAPVRVFPFDAIQSIDRKKGTDKAFWIVVLSLVALFGTVAVINAVAPKS